MIKSVALRGSVCVVLLALSLPAQAQTHHTISPALLGRLVQACAPAVDPVTQAAVISVESSGDAWVLHDNNDDRTYTPTSYPEAVRLANAIIARDRQRYGRNDWGLDVGVAQINSNNFAALGTNAAEMLHPCANLRQSSAMLSSAYAAQYAALRGVPEPQRSQMAARSALSMYNSGRPYGDDAYVEKVALALTSPLVRQTLVGPRPAIPAYPPPMYGPAAYGPVSGPPAYAPAYPSTTIAGGGMPASAIPGKPRTVPAAPAATPQPPLTGAFTATKKPAASSTGMFAHDGSLDPAELPSPAASASPVAQSATAQATPTKNP